MAHIAYLSITGKTQGPISQNCNTKDSLGCKAQSSHRDEITVLATSYFLEKDPANVHGANNFISITKPIDQSSPLLGNAFSKQEHLQCEIKYYRTNEQGYNEHFYTIQLADALITNIAFNQPNVLSSGDEDISEEITFKYRDIIWKHAISGTEGYESW